MSKLKDLLSMSRHERQGTLVVLAFMALIIFTIWIVKTCTPPPSAQDIAELQQWAEQVDSARQEAARIDSITQANKSAKRETHKKKDHADKKASKSNKKKHKSAPPPQGLPNVIPNY